MFYAFSQISNFKFEISYSLMPALPEFRPQGRRLAAPAFRQVLHPAPFTSQNRPPPMSPFPSAAPCFSVTFLLT